MRAKEYLKDIQDINVKIENKSAEVDYWKSVAVSTTTSMDGDKVRSTGNKQQMEAAVCRYVQLENEISAEIDRLIEKKQDIISHIERLPAVEYNVLHKMYVQGYELWQMPDKMGKSYSWVNSVHGSAIAHLQKILDLEENDKNY